MEPLTEEQQIVVKKVLSCIARVNGKYGKIRIAQILCGSRSKELTDNGLDKIITYNILSDFTQDRVLSILDALLQLGAAQSQGTTYPTLSLTRLGIEVMRSEKVLQFEFPQEIRKEQREKK